MKSADSLNTIRGRESPQAHLFLRINAFIQNSEFALAHLRVGVRGCISFPLPITIHRVFLTGRVTGRGKVKHPSSTFPATLAALFEISIRRSAAAKPLLPN